MERSRNSLFTPVTPVETGASYEDVVLLASEADLADPRWSEPETDAFRAMPSAPNTGGRHRRPEPETVLEPEPEQAPYGRHARRDQPEAALLIHETPVVYIPRHAREPEEPIAALAPSPTTGTRVIERYSLKRKLAAATLAASMALGLTTVVQTGESLQAPGAAAMQLGAPEQQTAAQAYAEHSANNKDEHQAKMARSAAKPTPPPIKWKAGDNPSCHPNVEYAFDFLMQQGLSDDPATAKEATAALIGNMMIEDPNLIPDRLQGYPARFAEQPEPGSGYAAMQWTTKSRQDGLKAFAARMSGKVSSLKIQLGYVMQELHSGYKAALSVLQDKNIPGSPQDKVRVKARAIMQKYLMPKDHATNGPNDKLRSDEAVKIFTETPNCAPTIL